VPRRWSAIYERLVRPSMAFFSDFSEVPATGEPAPAPSMAPKRIRPFGRTLLDPDRQPKLRFKARETRFSKKTSELAAQEVRRPAGEGSSRKVAPGLQPLIAGFFAQTS
jgi:hypothetical protein